MDVFISYSRPDRARIAKLASALERVGYSVWWDMNLTGGAQFSKETGENLNAARAVIVAWSKTSIESMWVADEATVGRTKKNLVPIAIDAVEPPLGFGQIHAIDFSGWGGEPGEPCFANLDKSLAGVLGRDPAVIEPVKPSFRRTAGTIAKRHWRIIGAGAAFAAAAFAFAAMQIGGRLDSHRSSAQLAENAIAVLPFVNAGSDARDDYLSEGVADELRDQLGRVAGLKVAARASSIAFRDGKIGAGEIARQLGVARLVEGSLLKQGSQLRISVQIIDGRTGYQSWSQSYNRTANDMLDIQQEIARAVVVEITRNGEAPAPATDDITAYDKLLLARHYEQEVRDAQEVDEAKLAKAIDLYRAAVASDPSSALAHSRLAGALLYAGDADAAEPEIFRALNLDPNLSEVQYTLGVFYFARSLPGVHAAFARAVELNPNNADALADYAFYEWGHTFAPLQDIEAAYLRALELDPMSLIRYAKLGYFFGVTGQRDKALAIIAKMTDRFTDANVYSSIAQILEQTGDFDLAVTAAKRALSLRPADETARAQIAELYAEIGDFNNAATYEPDPGLGQLFWRRDYPALISLAEERAIDQPEEAQLWYLLGFAYGAEGDYANAIRAMKIVGLPEGGDDESHVGGDQEGLATLASALAASGHMQDAQLVAETTVALMQKFLNSGADHGVWSNTLKSCGLAVLGRDDEAMATFAHVNDGPSLPRLPWLMDYPCFKRFANDKRYQSVITDVEKRRASLRNKVAEMDAAPNE